MGTDEFLNIAKGAVRRYTNDSYINGDGTPLWYLGKSIELLSTADVAYFLKGWNTARGCRIEYMCANDYGIGAYFEEE